MQASPLPLTRCDAVFHNSDGMSSHGTVHPLATQENDVAENTSPNQCAEQEVIGGRPALGSISPSSSSPNSVAQHPFVLAMDPHSTKLLLFLDHVAKTKGLRPKPKTSSICQLLLEGKCQQGTKCHQVHVSPASIMRSIREAAEAKSPCCWFHCSEERMQVAAAAASSAGVKTGGNGEAMSGGHASAVVEATSPTTLIHQPTRAKVPPRYEPEVRFIVPLLIDEPTGSTVVVGGLPLTKPPNDVVISTIGACPSERLLYTLGIDDPECALAATTKSNASNASVTSAPSTTGFPTPDVQNQLLSSTTMLSSEVVDATAEDASPHLDNVQREHRNEITPVAVPVFPLGKVCRLHRAGNLCRFGEECLFLHVCRQIVHPMSEEETRDLTPPPGFSATNKRHHRPARTAIAQIQQPTAQATSPSTLTTAAGGAAPLSEQKSSSDGSSASSGTNGSSTSSRQQQQQQQQQHQQQRRRMRVVPAEAEAVPPAPRAEKWRHCPYRNQRTKEYLRFQSITRSSQPPPPAQSRKQ